MRVLAVDASSTPFGLGRPVATIGNFDGLHRGHRAIVAETQAAARRAGELALVITFEPHPVRVLHPASGFCRLKTLDQRLAALAGLGVDAVALVRFDAALAALTPHAFAERVLGHALGVSQVLVGPDFRFGHRRRGDFAELAGLGVRLGFAARALAPVLDDGVPVSSTRIRDALARGAVEEAARLLSEPFAIEGAVVRGKGRGGPILLPTANLAPDNECLPAPGVYATRVEVRGEERPGATFLGEPATFGEVERVCETHLPGWTGGELYGERLRLAFRRRLRGAVAFPSIDALRAQIERDVADAQRP